MNTSTQTPPVTIRLGSYVAIIQVAVAFGVGIYLIYRDLTSGVSGTIESEAAAAQWIGTGTAVFIFILFGVVLAGATSLLRGKTWGRSPIVMMGALLLPVAWYMISEGMVAAGAATGISAVCALGLILHPRSTGWIADRYGR